MKYTFVMVLIIYFLAGCSNLRTVGNSEMHYLKPAECTEPGIIHRDGVCYQRIIISAKSDAHVTITEGDSTYEVDNTGQPSFAHDLASAVQAIAIQKAIRND